MPYESCDLCGHMCRVDRTSGKVGVCGQTAKLKIARAALHMWEEPPVSGRCGSGTVFFSGCSLSCLFCQNAEISHDGVGKEVEDERLHEIMLSLQAQKAHNINLVTPTHFVPTIIKEVKIARNLGLCVPIVYNTSSFDTEKTVKSLENTVDVYLADFKYVTPKVASAYSGAPDYPKVAKAAIAEMVRQQPSLVYDETGLLLRGVIVRVLLLPGHVAESKLAVSYLYKTYGDGIIISLLNQYTPHGENLPKPLDRKVTKAEYRDLCDYADKIGVKNAFIQEGGAAKESFIPAFNGEGIVGKGLGNGSFP